MTCVFLSVLLAIASTDIRVEAETMQGEQIRGVLEKVTAQGVTIAGGPNGSQELSFDRLQRLRLGENKATTPADGIRVLLTDGTFIFASDIAMTDGRMAVHVPDMSETMIFSAESVAGVLFQPDAAEAEHKWREQTLPARATDALAVKRDKSLLTLEGIIGDIDSDSLTFILDGERLSVNRAKLHSIAFAHREPNTRQAAQVVDGWGNRWMAAKLDWREDGVRVVLVDNTQHHIPFEQLREVDLGSGRIVWLSDLEPALVQHVPFFDQPWEICRDRNFHGDPLQVGTTVFSKGLAIHSKTLIEFELDREFDRFESLVGIEKSAGIYGNAVVRIRTDNSIVFEAPIRAGEPPLPVSVSVENARLLQLEVDYGEFLDLGDWAVWGNARLIR